MAVGTGLGSALADRWWHAPLDGRLGASVVLAGGGLSIAGTLLEPRADPWVEYAWWAQLLALVFWAGACGAAAGLLRRRRAALLGALLSATSFAVSAALVPFVTTAGVTRAWLGEQASALAFAAIVLRAIAVSRRPPAPRGLPQPAARRALA